MAEQEEKLPLHAVYLRPCRLYYAADPDPGLAPADRAAGSRRSRNKKLI